MFSTPHSLKWRKLYAVYLVVLLSVSFGKFRNVENYSDVLQTYFLIIICHFSFPSYMPVVFWMIDRSIYLSRFQGRLISDIMLYFYGSLCSHNILFNVAISANIWGNWGYHLLVTDQKPEPQKEFDLPKVTRVSKVWWELRFSDLISGRFWPLPCCPLSDRDF